MAKILGALAAVTLALVLSASPAAARCWWHGHHRHCLYGRYHHVVARPFYRFQYYDPYRYQYYPYYAYYPGPSYAYNYHGCFPFWPFCW